MAKHYEDDLSMAVARFLKLKQPACMWWHSPNGGKRNKPEAARLKKMGVLAGVPDYIFVLPDCSIGFIELKLDNAPQHKKTYLSPGQNIFKQGFEDITERPDRYAVCRSIIEVGEVLDRWGVKWMGSYNGKA